MLMKNLQVFCTECGWTDEMDDTHKKYEQMLEEEDCPGCAKKFAEAL